MRPLPSFLLRITPKSGLIKLKRSVNLKRMDSLDCRDEEGQMDGCPQEKKKYSLRRQLELWWGKQIQQSGKKFKKICANKSIHKAHVEDGMNGMPIPTYTPQHDHKMSQWRLLYDPAMHGRMNMTMEPAKLLLTAIGEYDCVQIFEI